MVEILKTVILVIKLVINFYLLYFCYIIIGVFMSENFIPSILFVEPTEALLTVLSYNLERYGFVVNTCKDGNAILTEVERIRPNIIIIDDEINTDFSLLDACATIRNKPSCKESPIIIITKETAKYASFKESNHLNDFIAKPFSPSELVIKINTIFSKYKPQAHSKVLEYKELKMNVGSYKVTLNGKNIHLGPTEFKILQCLMEMPSRILSREHIMNHVWGFNSNVQQRTIDVHINRLRSALKNDNNTAPTIKTIRSAGYCLSIFKE